MLIKLPIKEQPMIQALQMRAFELSVFEAYGESVKAWIFGKYINLRYTPDQREKFNYTIYSKWFPKDGATILQSMNLSVAALMASGIDIAALACEMLRGGNYMFGYYDEFYIPHKLAFGSHHFKHDFFVYGYDDGGADNEARKFFSMGYTVNRRYEKFEFSFKQFLDSVYNMPDGTVYLNFCRLNPDFKFDLEPAEIYLELGDFLHSCCSRDRPRDGFIFGLDCEREYIRYIDRIRESGEKIDVRFSRLFMELKNIMLLRLEYLTEKNIVPNREIHGRYLPVAKKAELIHNLCMRYNLSGKPEALMSAALLQNEIIHEEQDILYEVYDNIRTLLKNKEVKYE